MMIQKGTRRSDLGLHQGREDHWAADLTKGSFRVRNPSTIKAQDAHLRASAQLSSIRSAIRFACSMARQMCSVRMFAPSPPNRAPTSLSWRKVPLASLRGVSAKIQPAEMRDMPYCPICKAEYRTGFARRCHCLALLVGSSSEADAKRVVLLWEGLSRHKFEALVAALHDANIPNRARCGTDTGAAYIFNLRGRRLLKVMKKRRGKSPC